MKKEIASLMIGHDRPGGLSIEALRAFVQAYDANPGCIIEYDYRHSDHESASWNLIDAATLSDHPDLNIDGKTRKLAAAMHEHLKRQDGESERDWRGRVDKALRDAGYYLEGEAQPEWVLLLDVEHELKNGAVFIDGNEVSKVYPYIVQ